MVASGGECPLRWLSGEVCCCKGFGGRIESGRMCAYGFGRLIYFTYLYSAHTRKRQQEVLVHQYTAIEIQLRNFRRVGRKSDNRHGLFSKRYLYYPKRNCFSKEKAALFWWILMTMCVCRQKDATVVMITTLNGCPV